MRGFLAEYEELFIREYDNSLVYPKHARLTGIYYDGLASVSAQLNSCLEELRNILGDSTPEHVLIDAIMKNNFEFEKALNSVLNTQGTKYFDLSFIDGKRNLYIIFHDLGHRF